MKKKRKNENDFESVDEIDDEYKNISVDVDEKSNETYKLIKKALDNKEQNKQDKYKGIEFDTSKDNVMYDELLKDVFKKIYVNSYIYKDDNIVKIKSKITRNILNNKKFGNNSYILPSRQFLWSQYMFNNEVRDVMIGQKWLNRMELLNIDVIPNKNIKVYEELRGKLKVFRNNIKRFGSKIRRIDDSYNILYDYENYYTNNELFMIDIYNELDNEYKPNGEELKNLLDIYIKVYFNEISSDDFKNILNYLNNKKEIELSSIQSNFNTIKNDLIMENEVMKVVNNIGSNIKYTTFHENYITQSNIIVNVKIDKGDKIDLYRVFNNFITSEEYPFIQYQTVDGKINYKYNNNIIKEYQKDKQLLETIYKWFEYSPYAINFKIRLKDSKKFMSISLNELGRIEYKTQWKEEDKATIADTIKTYEYIKKLLENINKQNSKFRFIIPKNNQFKYAFINTIQKFELPGKFIINHNDLSNFSRNFFPYVSLVIDPRKRVSKTKTNDDKKGKYGTYLRYKRVTNYDSKAKIEQRILYFMRNYDFNDKSLSKEISKQFNLTDDKSLYYINKVRSRYPVIRRSRKNIKTSRFYSKI